MIIYPLFQTFSSSLQNSGCTNQWSAGSWACRKPLIDQSQEGILLSASAIWPAEKSKMAAASANGQESFLPERLLFGGTITCRLPRNAQDVRLVDSVFATVFFMTHIRSVCIWLVPWCSTTSVVCLWQSVTLCNLSICKTSQLTSLGPKV